MAKYSAFPGIHLPDRKWPDQTISQAPIWCSVDLRDGNQALINPMGAAKKLDLFRTLVKIGFKEIEVGFPAASDTDYAFVRELIEKNLIPDDVTIQVLVQSRKPLIDRTFEALQGAKNSIVHLYNSTSELQRRVVFNASKDEILRLAVDGAKHIYDQARSSPDNIRFEYSPESFTGTEVDFAVDICEAVCEIWRPTPAKKTILNLPSTVELATPNVYADQIELFCRKFSARDSVIISLHTHNDRGTGIAASELGLMAGADRIEGTLFGNGERTGNLDVVTMALNMFTQGVDPKLDFSNLKEIRRVAEFCTELKVHERSPYAGDLVFTAFSGSHQDAIKKGFAAMKDSGSEAFAVPYLTIDPADIGRQYDPVIRVNSQSGKGGVAFLVEQELGYQLPRRLQIAFSQVIQKVTDSSGREITSKEVADRFVQTYIQPPALLLYHSHTPVECENTDEERYRFTVTYKDQKHEIEGQGAGPLDSFIHAIRDSFSLSCDILDYHEHAMEAGSDSTAASYVLVRTPDGQELFGVGQHKSITKASLLGLIAAINRSLFVR